MKKYTQISEAVIHRGRTPSSTCTILHLRKPKLIIVLSFLFKPPFLLNSQHSFKDTYLIVDFLQHLVLVYLVSDRTDVFFHADTQKAVDVHR